MLIQTIGFLLMLAAFSSVHPATADEADRGYIIRTMDQLVFIDLGRRDGVQVDDLFDILASEAVRSPVSGDTVGVSQRSVGDVRVRQVEDKLAVAQIVYLQHGEDPMLMRIRPIESENRLAEVGRYLHGIRTDRARPSRLTAVVPGLYQLRQGQHYKGMVIMGLEAAALATGLGYRNSSDDWYDRYANLPDGLPEEDYARYLDAANRRRTRSNHFLLLAGVVYAYHLIDLLRTDTGSEPGWAQRPSASLQLSAGLIADGTAAVRLSRKF